MELDILRHPPAPFPSHQKKGLARVEKSRSPPWPMVQGCALHQHH